MSHSRFLFHPQAIIEAQEAKRWYKERSERAARGFLVELLRAFEMIDDRPETWPAFSSGDRRFLLHKYPFLVAHRLIGGQIQIVAIAHQRRRPNYWRNRK